MIALKINESAERLNKSRKLGPGLGGLAPCGFLAAATPIRFHRRCYLRAESGTVGDTENAIAPFRSPRAERSRRLSRCRGRRESGEHGSPSGSSSRRWLYMRPPPPPESMRTAPQTSARAPIWCRPWRSPAGSQRLRPASRIHRRAARPRPRSP